MHWTKRHNEPAWRISQGILTTFCAPATERTAIWVWISESHNARSATIFTLRAFFDITIPVFWLLGMICVLISLAGIGVRTQKRRVVVAIMCMISGLGLGMSFLLMYVLSYANLYP